MATITRFKILLATCGLLIAMATHVSADWWLVWDPPASGSIDGYKIHYGTNKSNLSKSVKVGNVTQYNLNKLPLSENVQYFISVSAYNAVVESGLASPLAYTPEDTTPPTPPTGLKASPP